MFYDVGTRRVQAFPAQSKGSQQLLNAMKLFAGEDDEISWFYADGAKEIRAAAQSAGWTHEQSLPHTPSNNAIAERQVGIVKHGARTRRPSGR